MSDPSWEAYLKIMPTAAVVGVDRHGAVSLFDGPIFFSINAGRWCGLDYTVNKVSVGLMPVTGDFSPESAYKLNPDNNPELTRKIIGAIKGAPVADPVPGQWTGTLDNKEEMAKMKEVVKATEALPTTIGFMEPDYQSTAPPLFTQSMSTPSIVDRGGVIPMEVKSSIGPAPLVVTQSVNSTLAAQLRNQAAQLMKLADTLEKS